LSRTKIVLTTNNLCLAIRRLTVRDFVLSVCPNSTVCLFVVSPKLFDLSFKFWLLFQANESHF